MSVLTAFFPHAADVGEALRRVGEYLPPRAITVLAGPSSLGCDLGVRVVSKWALGATLGGLLGAAAGAALGSVLAAGSCIVPVLGLVLAGPLIAGLAGAGAIGPVGALFGGLVGAARPSFEAGLLDEGHGALVAVRCPSSRVAFVANLLTTTGGRRVRAIASASG